MSAYLRVHGYILIYPLMYVYTYMVIMYICVYINDYVCIRLYTYLKCYVSFWDFNLEAVPCMFHPGKVTCDSPYGASKVDSHLEISTLPSQ